VAPLVAPLVSALLESSPRFDGVAPLLGEMVESACDTAVAYKSVAQRFSDQVEAGELLKAPLQTAHYRALVDALLDATNSGLLQEFADEILLRMQPLDAVRGRGVYDIKATIDTLAKRIVRGYVEGFNDAADFSELYDLLQHHSGFSLRQLAL